MFDKLKTLKEFYEEGQVKVLRIDMEIKLIELRLEQVKAKPIQVAQIRAGITNLKEQRELQIQANEIIKKEIEAEEKTQKQRFDKDITKLY